jgi:hypothetical protein
MRPRRPTEEKAMFSACRCCWWLIVVGDKWVMGGILATTTEKGKGRDSSNALRS